MQITPDSREPAGAASPMGYSVSGKNLDASQAPGIRTHTIESELCKNEIPAIPSAQK